MSCEDSFASQLASRASRLRACQTKVTDSTGSSFIELRTEDGFSKTGAQLDSSSTCPGFVVDTKPDLRCSQIKPYLYLGSQDVASDRNVLEEHCITDVLCLVPPSVFDENDDLLYLSPLGELNHSLHSKSNSPLVGSPRVVYAPLLDIPEHPVAEMFPATRSFIRSIKHSGGTVLVHCNAGVSRAPTVVIAYLMAEYGKSFKEAYDCVKEKRSFIRPNEGFLQQLKEFECTMKLEPRSS